MDNQITIGGNTLTFAPIGVDLVLRTLGDLRSKDPLGGLRATAHLVHQSLKTHHPQMTIDDVMKFSMFEITQLFDMALKVSAGPVAAQRLQEMTHRV